MHKVNITPDEKSKVKVIQEILSVLKNAESLASSFQQICNLLPGAYENPDSVSAKIMIDDQIFYSQSFKETQWVEKHIFETPGIKESALEIYFTHNYLEKVNRDFILKDTSFLVSVATILSGAISRFELTKLLYENTERLKELRGIKMTAEVLNRSTTLEESLQEICSFLPEAWQFPEYTVTRITYEDKVFKSRNFKETPWVQSQQFETPMGKKD